MSPDATSPWPVNPSRDGDSSTSQGSCASVHPKISKLWLLHRVRFWPPEQVQCQKLQSETNWLLLRFHMVFVKIHCWFLNSPSGKQELLCCVSWHLWRWFCFHTINDKCALWIGKLHTLPEGTVSLAEFSGAPLLQDISPGKECSFCFFGLFFPFYFILFAHPEQKLRGRKGRQIYVLELPHI